MIHFEGADYEVCGDDCCFFSSIVGDFDCFRVPSAIFTGDGKRYRITGISPSTQLRAMTITFDESSEITGVPASLIGQCNSLFILPPKVKRVVGMYSHNFPKIISNEGDQRFVSTAGSRVIMNHFPLEVAYTHSFKHRIFIRESVRFVGNFSFNNNESITSVVFPSSVESIGDHAFNKCHNLRFIIFKDNSKLKTIECYSFYFTALLSVDIPSCVEVIRYNAFSECRHLRSVMFHEDSKLKRIGDWSFNSTAIKHFDVPLSIEEISSHAFDNCYYLRTVTFHKESKLANIGKDHFHSIFLESVDVR